MEKLIYGNDNVVTTYDYFTLGQAFEILENIQKEARQEERQKARQKRIERVETIKLLIGLLTFCVVLPLLMFIHWLAFGY